MKPADRPVADRPAAPNVVDARQDEQHQLALIAHHLFWSLFLLLVLP